MESKEPLFKFVHPENRKPSEIATPQQLLNRFKKYVQECEEKNLVSFERGKDSQQRISKPWLPSMTGFALFLGIARSSLYKFAEKPELSDTITRIKEAIEVNAMNYASAGIVDSKITFNSYNINKTGSQEIEENDSDDIGFTIEIRKFDKNKNEIKDDQNE